MSGVPGRAGRTVVAEARRRGHEVTAVVRDPSRVRHRRTRDGRRETDGRRPGTAGGARTAAGGGG